MPTLQHLDRIEAGDRKAYVAQTSEMRRYVKIHLGATQLGQDALKALKEGDKEGVRNLLNQIIRLGKEK